MTGEDERSARGWSSLFTDAGVITQEAAQVSLRPRRMAYLIEIGNDQHFRRAVSYATTEWGGVSHPIVPVRKGGRIDGLWSQVCEVLDVEVLIDFAGLATDIREKVSATLGLQVTDPSLFDRGMEPGIHTMVATPPGSLDRRGVLTASPDAGLLTAVALGIIPEDQDEIWAQSGAVYQRQHSLVGLLSAQLYDQASSIGLTAEQLPTFHAEGVFSGAFFIFSARRTSVSRALYFWNMRTLCNRFGREHDRFIILPPEAFQDAEVIDRLKVFLGRKRQTSPNFVILSEDRETALTLGVSAGFVESKDTKLRWHFAGKQGSSSFDPMSFLPNLHPAAFVMGKRREGRTRTVVLPVTRPKTTLHVESPAELNMSIHGYLRLDVRGVSAWSWPRSDEVAKLIHRNAVAVDEGFSLLTSPNSVYQFDLSVPEPQEVCSAFLRDRGWSWTLSDKGKYAASLVEAHGLGSLSIVSSSQTLDVVAALASTSRIKAEQLLERTVASKASAGELGEIVSQILPYGVRRWLTVSELSGELQRKKSQVLPTLTELLELGLVQRGLEFDCPTCGLSTFFGTDRAQDRLRCPGCRAEGALLGPSRSEPVWAYSLNSLLDRTWDQNCLDHVLLLRWLKENGRIVWGAPGADVRKGDRQKEVDLLALSHGELQIAEMKPPGAFTPEVITQRVKLAEELGARRLLLASLETWPANQVRAAQELAAERLIVEVIDRGQLVT